MSSHFSHSLVPLHKAICECVCGAELKAALSQLSAECRRGLLLQQETSLRLMLMHGGRPTLVAMAAAIPFPFANNTSFDGVRAKQGHLNCL